MKIVAGLMSELKKLKINLINWSKDKIMNLMPWDREFQQVKMNKEKIDL